MSFMPKEENIILTTEPRLNLDLTSTFSEDYFPQVDELLSKARKAAAVFTQYTQEQADKIVYAVVRTAISHSREFAKLAREETRMGLFEDKILINIVANVK